MKLQSYAQESFRKDLKKSLLLIPNDFGSLCEQTVAVQVEFLTMLKEPPFILELPGKYWKIFLMQMIEGIFAHTVK